MAVQPRQNDSPEEEVENIRNHMVKNEWKDLEWKWDDQLTVWRARGTWRGQLREGRGSTPVHALSALARLTPATFHS